MHVYERLKYEGTSIECFIDQRANELELPVPTYVKEQIPKQINVVINTLIKEESEVKGYIEDHYPGVEVIHIRELLSLALRGDKS